MRELRDEIQEALDHINPADCDYTEWLNVGMTLKNEGLPFDMWDQWSLRDPDRFKSGKCLYKWNTFDRDGLNKDTIFWLCRRKSGHIVHGSGDWKKTYYQPAKPITHKPKILKKEPGEEWDPKKDMIAYLSALYDSDDYVSYTTACAWNEEKGKWEPRAGVHGRTAGQLIEELKQASSIEEVLGDYNREAGAWITINPTDGKGKGKDNITDYRYALVEADESSIEDQCNKYVEMNLPVVCLVYSGSRSAHAVVHVGAKTKDEHAQRFDKLLQVCEEHGLKMDPNNRDVSRLSRAPGFLRNGHKQFLMAKSFGAASWDEWEASLYVSNLPEEIPLSAMVNPPPLRYPLIDGYLREEESLLLSGAPKAGKSYLTYQMALAIATGRKWLNHRCRQKTVLYLDGELSPELIANRFKAIQEKMLIPVFPDNLHVISTKSKMISLDDIASDLEHYPGKYEVIIIDPLYMFIDVDENDNSQMASQMKMIRRMNAAGASVIVVHHMSKGIQAGKASIDRASGAGVLGRFFDSVVTLNKLDDEAEDHGIAERIEADTRSFRKPEPLNVWFDEFHTIDTGGDLSCRSYFNPLKANIEKKNENIVSKTMHCYHWMNENGKLDSDKTFSVQDYRSAYGKEYGKEPPRNTAYDHLEKAGFSYEKKGKIRRYYLSDPESSEEPEDDEEAG